MFWLQWLAVFVVVSFSGPWIALYIYSLFEKFDEWRFKRKIGWRDRD